MSCEWIPACLYGIGILGVLNLWCLVASFVDRAPWIWGAFLFFS